MPVHSNTYNNPAPLLLHLLAQTFQLPLGGSHSCTCASRQLCVGGALYMRCVWGATCAGHMFT